MQTPLDESAPVKGDELPILPQAISEIERILQSDIIPIQNADQVVSFADNTVQDYTNQETDDTDDTNLMSGDNPLLARVQEAIFRQLTERNNRLDISTRENDESMRTSKKKREEIGVELYNLQQELSKIQVSIDTTEKESETTRIDRERLSGNLVDVNKNFVSTNTQFKTQKKTCESQRLELETLSRSIKQLDMHKLELESKLKLAKRTTLKAEEDAVLKDNEKRRQDYMIDGMMENLRQIQERKALHEAQVDSQEAETKAIQEVIQDTTTEIQVSLLQAIQLEKKQLFNQWKSSIFIFQKREEIHNDVERGVQLNLESINSLEKNIHGFKLATREVNETTESLDAFQSKIGSETQYLRTQLESISDQQTSVKIEYSKYNSVHDMNESELKAQAKKLNSIQNQINNYEKQIQMMKKATKKIDDTIADTLNDQISLHKGNHSSKKDTSKIRTEINDKEAVTAQIRNEVATLGLDSLTYLQNLEQSKAALAVMDTQFFKLNKGIEDREIDMKRMTDDVGKRQTEIDILNKKFDILNKTLNESSGPLESIIKKISTEISIKELEAQTVQKNWLKLQNELLSVTMKSSALAEHNESNQMKLTVLNRKRIIYDSQFDSENQELRAYQRGVRKSQKDIERICSMVAKHKNTQANLEEKNFGLQQELRSKLKDVELESIRFESQIKGVQSEKEKALQGLIEAERQIMLWEKKIEMVKETQSALDPNIGASEAQEMQAEIHRMKLKHGALLKLQERMICDMEKCVERREVVHTKTKVKSKGNNQLLLERAISELGKKIRQITLDSQETESDIQNIYKAKDRVQSKMMESKTKCSEFETRERLLLGRLDEVSNQKNMALNATLLFQKIQKRTSDIKAGKYVFLVKDPELRALELEKQQIKMNKMHSIVKDIEICSDESIKSFITPFSAFLGTN